MKTQKKTLENLEQKQKELQNKNIKKEEIIMLNFCSLYSGSSGNSLFVETKNTKILIDAGVSNKRI